MPSFSEWTRPQQTIGHIETAVVRNGLAVVVGCDIVAVVDQATNP